MQTWIINSFLEYEDKLVFTRLLAEREKFGKNLHHIFCTDTIVPFGIIAATKLRGNRGCRYCGWKEVLLIYMSPNSWRFSIGCYFLSIPKLKWATLLYNE